MYSKDYYNSAEYNPEVIGMDIFRKMSQYMPYMVFITKAPEFKLLYANRKVAEFLELELDDLHEMDGRILDMMDGDDIVKLLEVSQRIQYMKADQAIKVKVKLKTKEGRVVHLETSVSVFRHNADGTPSEYFCVSEDVTEKVLLEMRAAELEMMTNSAEETFRYGAWEWFPEQGRVIWSKGIYDLFEEEDAASGSFTIDRYMSMIHPEDLAHFNEVIDEACEKVSAFSLEYRIVLSSNNVYYLQEQGKPIVDENGAIIKFIGTIRDVSYYWETLNDLHKYEATLQQAEKNLQLGTWEWDLIHSKVKWSDGFWNILEYPESLRTDDWMPIEDYYKHVTQENLTLSASMVNGFENYDGSLMLEPLEITLQTYTGKVVHAVTYTRILEWKDGKPSIAVGSTANITQMKNVQKSLEAKVSELAKAYDEMEQFSYVASHDLQEPLRKINAFSERLKDKCGSSLHPDCVHYLDRIMDGTNRMRILIENLLSLSRTKRNADHFKMTNLSVILSEVISDLEDKIAQKSAVIHCSKLPIIDAIPTQMHQLFLNILANSLKFSTEDNSTVIHISHEVLSDKQKNEYSLDMQQEYIHIRVKDNGIGFDSAFADTIFTPFKRLHGRSEYEGTGIGLAICKKVVQNHMGMIWAESNPGAGATFHIVLSVRQNSETLNPV